MPNFKKTKITLIAPPSPWLEDPITTPPFGLLYIASTLLKNGHEVEFFDCNLRDIKEIEYSDFYGVTCTTPHYPYVIEIGEYLKAKFPKSKLMVGGPHPTFLPEEILQESKYDIAVMGEGEITCKEIVENIDDLSKVKGICYKEDGRIINNGRRVPVENLDLLPFPARHLINLDDYHRTIRGERATLLFTSRGCPYFCAFCARDEFERRVRYRSVNNVVKEIKEMKEKGINCFIIEDDTIALNKGRLRELCENFRRLGITWRGWLRANEATPERLKLMKQGGCVSVFIGIESGSQKILDILRKGTTVEENKNAILNTKAAGIKVRVGIIIGSPGETEETIEETKRLLLETRPDDWVCFTFVPIVGCEIWRYPERFGIEITSTYGDFWNIGKEGLGAISFRSKTLSTEKLIELRARLISELRQELPFYKGDDL
jgi:radical SAM superfamily enzyme YgiQ (UPF0313 family)